MTACDANISSPEMEKIYNSSTQKFNRKRMYWFTNCYRLFSIVSASTLIILSEPISLKAAEVTRT
jgi:hypothetical protein